MNPDEEARLLLYVYGELAHDEREALEARLAADPALRHQLAALEADLANLDSAFDAPAPADGFEERLWQQLKPRLSQPVASAPRSPSARHRRTPRATSARRFGTRVATSLAWAASVLLALGMGLWLGQGPQPVAEPPALATSAGSLDGERILAGELVGHLKATEQVLLLATHEPDQGALAKSLARELIESHRLYAAAAERAGRPQLAQALRQLEPALLELATAPRHTVDALLRAAIESEDLPFKARSAAWAVENQMQTAGPHPPRG